MQHSFHASPQKIKAICLGLKGSFISRMANLHSLWKQFKSEFVMDFKNWMSENYTTLKSRLRKAKGLTLFFPIVYNSTLCLTISTYSMLSKLNTLKISFLWF